MCMEFAEAEKCSSYVIRINLLIRINLICLIIFERYASDGLTPDRPLSTSNIASYQKIEIHREQSFSITGIYSFRFCITDDVFIRPLVTNGANQNPESLKEY